MSGEDYRAGGAGATVPFQGILLDTEAATRKLLAESVRSRRKPSPFARRYASVLRAFGVNCSDWGTGTDEGPRYVTTNDRWNESKEVGEPGVPFWRCGPRRLPVWRLDHHLRPDRTSFEKLYITGGGLNGLAMFMRDADGHTPEQARDVLEAHRWACQTYFAAGDLYEEGSPRGWHGYDVVNLAGLTVSEYNALRHEAGIALHRLKLAQGFVAGVELKARLTDFDHRSRITKRGTLFALPDLRDPDALARFGALPLLDPGPFERMIRDVAKLAVNRVAAHVKPAKPTPDKRGAATKTTRRRSLRDDGFIATTSDPRDLKVQVVQWLVRRHDRMPTLFEALDLHNPLRPDDDEDEARRRKMQATIRFVARTFDPRKCGSRRGGRIGSPTGEWEDHEASCVALVTRHITPAAYEKAGIPDVNGRRNIPVATLAKVYYSLLLKSFTKEPDPKDQFTWGVDFIDGVAERMDGRGIKKQTRSDARRVLAACDLAECFDFDYFPTWGNLRGRSRKYHIGTARREDTVDHPNSDEVRLRLVGRAQGYAERVVEAECEAQ